jgi:hypothetical protein
MNAKKGMKDEDKVIISHAFLNLLATRTNETLAAEWAPSLMALVVPGWVPPHVPHLLFVIK